MSYSWNPGASSMLALSNLSAGNYTLTVTDTNGCTAQYGPIIISNTSPPSIANTALLTPDDCNQNNGSITGITVSGGTLPYAISWNNTAQTSLDIVNLSVGTYTLYVTDVFGCSDSLGPLLISSNGGPSIGMNGLNLAMVQCNGSLGGISGLSVSGGGNTYLWSNGTTTLDNPNLTVGTYVLTVTDQNNCTDSISLNITGYSAPLIDATMLSLIQPTCLQLGSISGIQVSNGTGNFSYIWSNTNQNTLDITNLSAGNYTLVVLDLTSNCSDTLSNIILTPPAYPVANFIFSPLNPDINELINFTNTSTGNWSIENWSIEGQNFSNSPFTFSFSIEGSYPIQLIVTNGQGCSDTLIQTITIYDDIIVPNVFTPNGDGVNEEFNVYGYGFETMLFQVFDRWGEKMFETTDPKVGWDGTFKGVAMPPGVYVFLVKALYIDGQEGFKKGSVTILK
jgi:gliding motility-associated-like protein